MRPEIKFQSYSERVFKNEWVHAFLYESYSIETHNHDFYEMNIVMQGTGTHQIENAHLEVKTGDIFVIPPMTIHSYYNTHNLDVYHILLHKDFISANRAEAEQMPGFLSFVEIEPFLRQHFSDAMFLHLSGSELMTLKSDLKFIEDNSEFDVAEMNALKNHVVWKIIYWLSYLLFRQINSEGKKKLSKYDYAIVQALEYIHKNYSEKITIELLCKQAYLSRSTFLRSFFEMCGCMPIEYLNRYRCNKAGEMLKNAEFSKTEIAQKCGFYDLSHMERTLKKFNWV